MKEIENWIKFKGDYQTGLELLKLHHPSNVLKGYFSQASENSFNRDKLKKELKKLISEKKPVVPSVNPSDFNRHSPAKLQPIDYTKLNEEQKQLVMKKNALVRQADILKERIRGCPDQEQRKELAIHVLNSWATVKEIWALLDQINQPSDEPKRLDFSALSLPELKALKQKCFVNRSKAKKRNPSKTSHYDLLILHINECINAFSVK